MLLLSRHVSANRSGELSRYRDKILRLGVILCRRRPVFIKDVLPNTQSTFPTHQSSYHTESSNDKMISNRSTSSDAHTGAQQSRARSTVPGLTLLGLAFLFLVSCANPASTQGTTPQRTPTTLGNHLSATPTPQTPQRTPTTLGNHLSATPTPQLTQQYDFTEQASGRTITYTVTSRFEIILNQQRYSKKNVQVSCTPPGTLGSVSNLPSVTPPLYVIRYEGIQPGLCTIKNGTFLLTVRIIA